MLELYVMNERIALSISLLFFSPFLTVISDIHYLALLLMYKFSVHAFTTYGIFPAVLYLRYYL